MKALISRLSNDRAEHYSGVYQIQGGMITDADLGEATDIAKARVNELGDDAIGSGVPVNDGIIALDSTALPTLRAGTVYADGLRGEITQTGTLNAANPLDLYNHQQDLPGPPVLPAAQALVFYADLWESPVTLLTEPRLTDPGLHGAETSFRTRTMAQIKAAPAADRNLLGLATGKYPQHGDIALTAELTTATAAADPCDPCATEVASAARVGNALFRVEVQDVQGPADNPTQITLLWSIENAAERYLTTPTPPPAFTQRAASVFEFFSKRTEAHKGAFADPASRHSSQVVVPPYPAATPNRTDGGPGVWPYVRRWDGMATITPNPLAIVGTPVNGAVSIDAGKLKIVLPAITLTLDVTGKKALTGDYWLVELREFATNQVFVESATPAGIVHHYATLFTTAATGLVAPLPDDDRRRASFPTLTDIPADHVSFDNNCPKLYGDPNTDGARNVQQALDRLCAIDASDIDFTNNCPNTFDHATNVQEALDALCKLDFSPRLGYRLLFDWGVVCGVRVRFVPAQGTRPPGVEISPGAILDRTGRLLVLPWDTPKIFALSDIKPTSTLVRGREYCLCLAISDALDVGIFLVEETNPELVRPEDRLYQQVYQDCLNPHFKFNDAVKAEFGTTITATKERFVMAVTGPEVLGSSLKLTAQEADEINTATNAIMAQFRADLSPEEATDLDRALAAADIAHNPSRAAGDAALFVRGQNAIAKFNAVAVAAPDPTVACACASYFPDCPGKDFGIPYVPIACVTLNPEVIQIQSVCEYCCRKQALTPRTFRYWKGFEFAEEMARRREECCPKPGTPKTPPFKYVPPKDRPVYVVDKEPYINPEIKWSPRPDVSGLNESTAKEALRGNGVDVTNVIHVDSGDPFAALSALGGSVSPIDRLESGGTISPGDKVALLMQDGVARDYVVVAKGDGQYLFPTGTEKITPSVDMTLVDGRLAEAAKARDDLTGEIAALETRRNDLASQVVNLKSDVDRLAASQTSVTQSVDATQTAKATLDQDIAALAARRDDLTQTVTGLKTSLDGMVAQQGQITTAITGLTAQYQQLSQSIREAQPVAVAVGDNPALVAQLGRAGVVTVGDFQRLAPARLNEIFTAANVPAADRARIVATVMGMIRPGG